LAPVQRKLFLPVAVTEIDVSANWKRIWVAVSHMATAEELADFLRGWAGLSAAEMTVCLGQLRSSGLLPIHREGEPANRAGSCRMDGVASRPGIDASALPAKAAATDRLLSIGGSCRADRELASATLRGRCQVHREFSESVTRGEKGSGVPESASYDYYADEAAEAIIDKLRAPGIGGDASSILNRIVVEWAAIASVK
jgi:hypothetical protein